MKKFFIISFIVVLGLTLPQITNNKSSYQENSLNNKILANQPLNLEVVGDLKPKDVHLIYKNGEMKRNIFLSYLKSNKKTYIYFVPELISGNYELSVDDNIISKFKLAKYENKPKTLQDCIGLPTDNRCLDEYFVSMVNSKKDVAIALDGIKELYTKYPDKNQVCHAFAHSIGIAASYYTSSLEEGYKLGDNACRGYYHGVSMGFTTQLSSVEFTKAIPNLCDFYLKTNEFYDCLHGVGHDIFLHYPTEFTKGSMLCMSLTYEDPEAKTECESGVAMGFVDFYNLQDAKFKNQLIPNKDVAILCSKLPGDLVEGCWRFIISAYIDEPAETIPGLFEKLCNKQETASKDGCWGGVGMAFMHRFPKSSIKEINNFCSKGLTEKSVMNCINLTLGLYYINSGSGGVKEICSTLPKDYKSKTEKCRFWAEAEANLIRTGGTDFISHGNTSSS